MSKTITLNPLSLKSIEKCIKELEHYEIELKDKIDMFSSKIADLGLELLDKRIQAIPMSAYRQGVAPSIAHETYQEGDKFVVELHMIGEEVAFIEFGAGSYFNGPVGTSMHPEGASLGMTIGSYNADVAKRDFWFYKDDNGNLVYTNGTPTYAPLWGTMQDIQEKIDEIFKEVFG